MPVLPDQKLDVIRQKLVLCIEKIEETFVFLINTIFDPGFIKSPERVQVLAAISQMAKNIMKVKIISFNFLSFLVFYCTSC